MDYNKIVVGTIWNVIGTDKNYEYHRKSLRSIELRQWVDEAFYKKNLKDILDSDFLDQLRKNDFFARLWELELAEWLDLTNMKSV